VVLLSLVDDEGKSQLAFVTRDSSAPTLLMVRQALHQSVLAQTRSASRPSVAVAVIIDRYCSVECEMVAHLTHGTR